jgi:hypothetical protein
MLSLKSSLTAAVLAASTLAALPAQASNVHWSVNLGFPVVSVPRVYAPAPVYYYPPAPVYYQQPAPVYYQPPPAYYQPPPVVVQREYYPRHRHHEHRDEYGDRHHRGRW